MQRRLLLSLFILLLGLSALTVVAQEKPVVTIYGAYTEGADQTIFLQDLTTFADANNITIVYEGDSDFEANVATRLSENTADIVGFPQPALLLANATNAVDLRDVFEMSYLQSQYNQSYIDLATTPDGKVAGIWGRATLKSLVWYSPTCFANAGYDVPNTWGELVDLTEQISADGRTPWVASMADGDLTGSVGTDWIEDILLRTTTLENYDRWTNLSFDERLPFASPELRRAWSIMGYFLLTPNYVFGGVDGMLEQPVQDTGLPLLDCSAYMAKQGTELRGWILDENPDLNIAPDGDLFYFYFPAVDVQYGLPALIGHWHPLWRKAFISRHI
ncbi:MAG: extracellular solute-binding protein [Anaerolineae bacterium]|nr:extracellular solute-binding protein [Anaerolineae bacterium]